MSSYKAVTTEYSVADAISSDYGEFQCLRDEMREAADNMSSANMEHLPKYEALEECASTLENFCDDEPEVPDAVGVARVQVTEAVQKRKGRGPSRAVRNDNAIAMLEAAKTCVELLHEATPDDDLETLIEKLDNDISEAEGLEFPGMYG